MNTDGRWTDADPGDPASVDDEANLGFRWRWASPTDDLGAWKMNDPNDPPAGAGNTAGTCGSRHSGGVVATFCDGHVVFLGDDIHYRVFQHLMTPDSRDASGGTINAAGVLDEADF